MDTKCKLRILVLILNCGRNEYNGLMIHKLGLLLVLFQVVIRFFFSSANFVTRIILKFCLVYSTHFTPAQLPNSTKFSKPSTLDYTCPEKPFRLFPSHKHVYAYIHSTIKLTNCDRNYVPTLHLLICSKVNARHRVTIDTFVNKRIFGER